MQYESRTRYGLLINYTISTFQEIRKYLRLIISIDIDVIILSFMNKAMGLNY